MTPQVPESVKIERSAALSDIQNETARKTIEKQLGKTRPVLFEGFENGEASGHTDNFIEVCVRSEQSLKNQLLPVRIN